LGHLQGILCYPDGSHHPAGRGNLWLDMVSEIRRGLVLLSSFFKNKGKEKAQQLIPVFPLFNLLTVAKITYRMLILKHN
jgi:hypothetical protein